MNRIELLDEDFPFIPKTVRFLQQISLEALNQIAKSLGDNSILFGCNVVSGNISAGAVVINGEILPIEAQPVKTYISIDEQVEDAIYKGEVSRPAYYTRKAVLSDTGTILFASLTRYQEKLVPSGAIIMWSGSPSNIPLGWALCNGQTVGSVVTPNLKGRFIVGYDPSDSNYISIGMNGGSKTVALTEAQMPAHDHDVTVTVGNESAAHAHTINVEMMVAQEVGGVPALVPDSAGGLDRAIVSTNESAQHTHAVTLDIASKGLGQAHENRPPYYVLAYIIKL